MEDHDVRQNASIYDVIIRTNPLEISRYSEILDYHNVDSANGDAAENGGVQN
jgi:hypothetical protein